MAFRKYPKMPIPSYSFILLALKIIMNIIPNSRIKSIKNMVKSLISLNT